MQDHAWDRDHAAARDHIGRSGGDPDGGVVDGRAFGEQRGVDQQPVDGIDIRDDRGRELGCDIVQSLGEGRGDSQRDDGVGVDDIVAVLAVERCWQDSKSGGDCQRPGRDHYGGAERGRSCGEGGHADEPCRHGV